jgi:predicted DNA-binding transcriptional regulator AlpA
VNTPQLQVHHDPAPPVDLEPLLTAEEVARILGVRLKRVYELSVPHVRISARALRYRRSDVAAFIERRRRS